jgi:hypothetical protein
VGEAPEVGPLRMSSKGRDPAVCHTWNSVCIWSILPMESDRIGFEAVICRVAAKTGQLLTSFVTVFTLCDIVVLAFVQTFCVTQNIRSHLGPPTQREF